MTSRMASSTCQSQQQMTWSPSEADWAQSAQSLAELILGQEVSCNSNNIPLLSLAQVLNSAAGNMLWNPDQPYRSCQVRRSLPSWSPSSTHQLIMTQNSLCHWDSNFLFVSGAQSPPVPGSIWWHVVQQMGRATLSDHSFSARRGLHDFQQQVWWRKKQF